MSTPLSHVDAQGEARMVDVTDKDVTLFTRQLATMMKAGVPLLQAFDIVGKGHANPAVGKLLMDIKADVETGSSLNQAFRKYPMHFDALFCNLVGADLLIILTDIDGPMAELRASVGFDQPLVESSFHPHVRHFRFINPCPSTIGGTVKLTPAAMGPQATYWGGLVFRLGH
mgnify:CR=1 FL=1